MMWIEMKLPQHNVLKCEINALFPLVIGVGGKVVENFANRSVETWLSRGGAGGITG